MTVLESKSLNSDDRVACGKHIGHVVGVAPYTVCIKWQDDTITVHQRHQMEAIRQLPPTWTESDRIARVARLEKEPKNPIPFVRDKFIEELLEDHDG